VPTNEDLHEIALHYHRQLTDRIRAYLNARGIPDDLIHRHLLGWSGGRITIPIPNRERDIAFFKLARDPEDDSGAPKMYATPGSSIELYGWEVIARKPQRLILAEGEFDRLVLEAKGFDAVTSTGGAGSWRPEWSSALSDIPEVFVCYDRDEAGESGSLRVARQIPNARIVNLPDEVGEGGDVTDFFVRLGRTPEEFGLLLEAAQLAPAPISQVRRSGEISVASAELSARIERVKETVPIEDLAMQYVELRPSGKNLIGRCPFHDDRSPSFVVFPETRSFHCFGCQAGGDVVNFLMLAMHLTFSEALSSLEKTLPNSHDRKSIA
jgi:DNA primase